MGRNILFVTTDQQRYDSLGCNGGKIARTPVADRLAAAGINYRRAHNQNTVCMPARSTMATGQYVRTHGVFANGVALPPDAPSIAGWLHGKAGYRTALIGKAHFEPAFDFTGRWFENRMAREGSTGPYRGFERMELAMHAPLGGWHYSLWLQQNHPNELGGFSRVLSAAARR
jgi:arylsulfatase A-like enzyme